MLAAILEPALNVRNMKRLLAASEHETASDSPVTFYKLDYNPLEVCGFAQKQQNKRSHVVLIFSFSASSCVSTRNIFTHILTAVYSNNHWAKLNSTTK